MSTINFEAMGKNELRAACKEHGIKGYGAMNNDGMRAALRAATTPEVVGEQLEEQVRETVTAGDVFASMFAPVFVPQSTAQSQRVVDGKKVEAKAVTNRPKGSVTPAPFVPRVIRKGYTIQKEREERNGVKRPSVGTVCGQVWDKFDANPTIQARDLPALADANGWNRVNVACEYYAWRKFNGIKGRQSK